jgi:hypothetical protein
MDERQHVTTKGESAMSENALHQILAGGDLDKLLEAALSHIPEDRLNNAVFHRFCEKGYGAKANLRKLSNGEMECVLGLGSTIVPGESRCNINVQPGQTFILNRLVIPSYCADDFLVTNIMVGKNSIFPDNERGVPAALFSEREYNFKLIQVEAPSLLFISVMIVNQSPYDKAFHGALIGHTPPAGDISSEQATPVLLPCGDTYG